MFQNHEPSGRNLYYVVSTIGASSKLGNFWICICMTGWIYEGSTARPDEQNRRKGRKSNKQIKVAVCNEFVETIICEYLGFKTVFSRWMPEQVSGALCVKYLCSAAGKMEAPCWRNSNVWYTVWTQQENNTASKSHVFTSASKLWQMSSRTISGSFLLIYFLVPVFADLYEDTFRRSCLAVYSSGKLRFLEEIYWLVHQIPLTVWTYFCLMSVFLESWKCRLEAGGFNVMNGSVNLSVVTIGWLW